MGMKKIVWQRQFRDKMISFAFQKIVIYAVDFLFNTLLSKKIK